MYLFLFEIVTLVVFRWFKFLFLVAWKFLFLLWTRGCGFRNAHHLNHTAFIRILIEDLNFCCTMSEIFSGIFENVLIHVGFFSLALEIFFLFNNFFLDIIWIFNEIIILKLLNEYFTVFGLQFHVVFGISGELFDCCSTWSTNLFFFYMLLFIGRTCSPVSINWTYLVIGSPKLLFFNIQHIFFPGFCNLGRE